MLDVCVTGATGFIGRSLCLKLLGQGCRVTALVRDEKRARDVLGAEVVPCAEHGEAASWFAAIDAADVVVNLAGAPVVGKRWTRARKAEILNSRVNTTQRLVDCLARAERKKRLLISASAVGYYGDRGAERLCEDASLGEGFLADVCAQWERTALRAANDLTRVALLRIGLVLGPAGGFLAKLMPVFRLGLGGPIGSGNQYMPWIHLHDLLELICRIMSDERFSGPINAAAPNPATNRDFSAALAAVLQRPAKLKLPSIALKTLLGDAADPILHSHRAEPCRSSELGFSFRYTDLREALTEIIALDRSVTIDRLHSSQQLPRASYIDQRKPVYWLRQTMTIPHPREQVFPFFTKPENLGAITPAALSFVIDQAPRVVEEGAMIDYKIALNGLPMRWRSKIEVWDPMARFVDAQHMGPYRCWWHEHRFVSEGENTVVEDIVFYKPPFGILGRVINWLFIRRKLRQIFGFRKWAVFQRYGQPSNANSSDEAVRQAS